MIKIVLGLLGIGIFCLILNPLTVEFLFDKIPINVYNKIKTLSLVIGFACLILALGLGMFTLGMITIN